MTSIEDQHRLAVERLHRATTEAYEALSDSVLALAADQKTHAETINEILREREAQVALAGQCLQMIEKLALRVEQLEVLIATRSKKVANC